MSRSGRSSCVGSLTTRGWLTLPRTEAHDPIPVPAAPGNRDVRYAPDSAAQQPRATSQKQTLVQVAALCPLSTQSRHSTSPRLLAK